MHRPAGCPPGTSAAARRARARCAQARSRVVEMTEHGKHAFHERDDHGILVRPALASDVPAHPAAHRALRRPTHPARQGERRALRLDPAVPDRRGPRRRARSGAVPSPSSGTTSPRCARSPSTRTGSTSGVGHRMLEALEHDARELGVARIFCLTFEVDFFAKHGYLEIGEQVVDPDVYAELRAVVGRGRRGVPRPGPGQAEHARQHPHAEDPLTLSAAPGGVPSRGRRALSTLCACRRSVTPSGPRSRSCTGAVVLAVLGARRRSSWSWSCSSSSGGGAGLRRRRVGPRPLVRGVGLLLRPASASSAPSSASSVPGPSAFCFCGGFGAVVPALPPTGRRAARTRSRSKPVLDKSTYGPTENRRSRCRSRTPGPKSCHMDLGSAQQVLTISSGEEQYWSSKDCQTGGTNQDVTIKAGQLLTTPAMTWDDTPVVDVHVRLVSAGR